MKKDGKYRFSLQFGADTEVNIRSGELLERLGNKKSAVVVAALSDYMAAHPELSTNTLKIRIDEELAIRREKLEGLIRDIVREQLSRINPAPCDVEVSNDLPEPLEDDIAQMISNLELFS